MVTLTLNLVCQYLLLTNKSAYAHCKKETNSVCAGADLIVGLFISVYFTGQYFIHL